jgi:hypothetical protein
MTDGDGDGAGELILGDNRILIPGDLTENDTIDDLNLCAPSLFHVFLGRPSR